MVQNRDEIVAEVGRALRVNWVNPDRLAAYIIFIGGTNNDVLRVDLARRTNDTELLRNPHRLLGTERRLVKSAIIDFFNEHWDHPSLHTAKKHLQMIPGITRVELNRAMDSLQLMEYSYIWDMDRAYQ